MFTTPQQSREQDRIQLLNLSDENYRTISIARVSIDVEKNLKKIIARSVFNASNRTIIFEREKKRETIFLALHRN